MNKFHLQASSFIFLKFLHVYMIVSICRSSITKTNKKTVDTNPRYDYNFTTEPYLFINVFELLLFVSIS